MSKGDASLPIKKSIISNVTFTRWVGEHALENSNSDLL